MAQYKGDNLDISLPPFYISKMLSLVNFNPLIKKFHSNNTMASLS